MTNEDRYKLACMRGDREAALAAIDIAKGKASHVGCWYWTDRAIDHARKAGIEDPLSILGNLSWPNLEALQGAVEALPASEQRQADEARLRAWGDYIIELSRRMRAEYLSEDLWQEALAEWRRLVPSSE
jgi:hypothetical protein